MAGASPSLVSSPGMGVTTATSAGSPSDRLPAAQRTPPVRKTIRVTREGWLWLLAGMLLWATGVYKGINLITLLATFLLAVWVLNVLLGGRRLGAARAVLRCSGPVFAHTPCSVVLDVTNAARTRLVDLRVDTAGTAPRCQQMLTSLPGRRSARVVWRVIFPHRGLYSWERLRLASGYPHGLVERGREYAAQTEQIVFPQLGRLHRSRLIRWLARAAISPHLGRGLPTRRPTAQTDFHGLRPFRPGDSPRWIHWRTTARRGELVVREFEEPPTNNLILVFDPWVGPSQGRASFAALLPAVEEAVRLAATICWEWCQETGHQLMLVTANRQPVTVSGPTGARLGQDLLRCLALVRVEAEAHPVETVSVLTARALPPGAVLVVGAAPERLVDTLTSRLRRPVVALDPATSEAQGFYERAARHAR